MLAVNLTIILLLIRHFHIELERGRRCSQHFFKLRNQLKIMFKKHWQFTVILAVLVTMGTVIILFAPIFPVEIIITQTRTIPLQYSAQDYNLSDVPRFVNVTNNDSVSGVFSVRLWMS